MEKYNRKRSFLLFIFVFSSFILVANIKDVTSAPGSSQNPIIFVHGWTGDASGWNTMKLRFYNDGWLAERLKSYTFIDTYNYTSEGNIINAESIENWVDDILNDTGAEKVDIIAHSMGGLSSRYYIKFLSGINKVDDFVSIASPHHGVYGGVEVFYSESTLLVSLNEGDETPGGILSDTIGSRVDPVGASIYNGTHIPGNIRYTSIYSTDDGVVSPVFSSELDGANNIQVGSVDHVSLIFDENIYTIIKNAVYDPKGNPNIPGYNLLSLMGFTSLLVLVIIKKQSSKLS